MQQDLTVSARRRRLAGAALVLAVLLAGLGGTWLAAAAMEGIQHRHAGELMDRYADDISWAVGNEADRYSDTLSSLAAAVSAQSNFRAGDYAEITSRLSRQQLPGVTSAVFVVAATPAQIPAVQAYWRGQGATGLKFAPQGSAAEHFFVVFGQPLDSTPSTLGRDVSAAAEPVQALQAARASGQVSASPTYVLLKDRKLPAAQQQMSFVLAAPVLAGIGTPGPGRFVGWVLMGMRGGDFIAETLAHRSQGAVSVALDDVSSGKPRAVVVPPGEQRADSLNRLRDVSVGQRTWQLRIYPTAQLLTSSDRRMPALTRILGLIITLLLTALVAILAGTRNRAMAKVDRATADLREDIEHRKQTETQLRERDGELRHLALHDPLTGLANRTLFYERVDHALLTHHRSRSPLAVYFIDLDGFKEVNDLCGHSAGDAVLVEVAARLRTCVRASDTIARIGGDEFAVLAEGMTAPEHAEVIAQSIVAALQAPFAVDGAPANVTASVGVTVHQPGAPTGERRNSDEMIRSADEAMYAAKTSGKDRYVLAGSGRAS